MRARTYTMVNIIPYLWLYNDKTQEKGIYEGHKKEFFTKSKFIVYSFELFIFCWQLQKAVITKNNETS